MMSDRLFVGMIGERIFVGMMGDRIFVGMIRERSLICWDDGRSLQGLLSMFLLHY